VLFRSHGRKMNQTKPNQIIIIIIIIILISLCYFISGGFSKILKKTSRTRCVFAGYVALPRQ